MTMQRHELDAWLGDNWTPEQRDKIAEDFAGWERDNPDAGPEESTEILTAICQHHDNTLDLNSVDSSGGLCAYRGRLRAAAIIAHRLAGVPEAEVARRAGVDRMTMRRWLGKR